MDKAIEKVKSLLAAVEKDYSKLFSKHLITDTEVNIINNMQATIAAYKLVLKELDIINKENTLSLPNKQVQEWIPTT